MLKRIYYFALLIIAAFMIAPLIVGILFEKNIRKFINDINKDQRIKIEILQYSRDWFTSTAAVQVTLSSKDVKYIPNITTLEFQPAESVRFIVQGTILHGPIIYNHHLTKLAYANIKCNLLIEPNNTKFMQINMRAGFNNTWYGEFSTAAWDFSLPYISKLSVAKLSGDFYIKLGETTIKHIKTNTTLGPVTIDFNDEGNTLKQIIIQPIISRYDATHKHNYLWSGKSSVYTPGMIITSLNGSQFNIEKMAITNTFSAAGNVLYNANMGFFIKNLTSPTFTIPAFAKLQITLSATNFDAQSLNNYLNSLQTKTPAELTSIDLKIVENVLAGMIKTNSIIRTTIVSDTSLGAFSGKTKTIWPENVPLPKTFSEISTNSKTIIILKLSNLLVLKLLSIYGDQLTASDSELAKARLQTEKLEEENFRNQQASNNTELKQTVDELVKQNQIAADTAAQIINMSKQKQPISIFSSNIDQLSLPFNIKNQIKLVYQIQHQTEQTISLDAKTKQLMKDLISINYLRKEPDKDEYTSKIIFKDGQVFISGSPLINAQEVNATP